MASAEGARVMRLVGLMSGTSLDGISAAVARFTDTPGGRPTAVLESFVQRPYSHEARLRLESAMQQGLAKDYCRLHADLGDWLADAALEAMQMAGVTAAEVSAIASHGQTLWHEPGHSTWQIGDPARIAERTGCAVIADFRTRDMAAGGQGAPLVSMADVVLFAHETEWRALQNIGGIGNVTVVPPIGDASPVRAFDTGPGVVVIDGVVRRLFDQPYDADGVIARSGQMSEVVLREYLDLPYLRQAPPKTTGRELFTPAFIDAFIARCAAAPLSPADTVATAVAFTAATIAGQYALFVDAPIGDVVLSGGGSKNPALVHMIEASFQWQHEHRGRPRPVVRRFDDLFFDAEAKEAVAFALLGYLHLTGRPGNVPSATGARGPRVLGALTPANSVEWKS
jgi:anhydro-N-acetylmuramic acid kinase